MRLFYFIGGPKAGKAEEFFRRLQEIGGTPSSWKIYPHADQDGRALHLAAVASPQEILDHLQHFDDIYQHTEIIEILERPQPRE
jgi:hypothetical protein